MIKFFRRIRQKLLSENKFSKYLIYALGEIILVVIGILIALSLNNQNELEKDELRIKLALSEIQENLFEDIAQAQKSLDGYLTEFEIAQNVLDFEDPFTYQDYKAGKLKNLGSIYSDFIITKSGYENLTSQLDKIPEKYRPILNDLRELYVNLDERIKVSNQRIRNTVYSHLDFTSDQNWNIYRAKYDDISPAELEYFIDSDAYKRYLFRFGNDRNVLLIASHMYRLKAIETIIKIDSFLNKKHSQLNSKLLGRVRSKAKIEKYLGTYKSAESTSTIPISRRVFYSNDYLYTVDNLGDTLKHYRIHEERYFFMQPTVNYPVVWEFVESMKDSIRMDFLNRADLNLPSKLIKAN